MNLIGYSYPHIILREIIVYSWNTINAYFLFLHEWWVTTNKFVVKPTIHVRGGTIHL